MLITDAYREQNRQLHAERPDYGAGSARWAKRVADICILYGCNSVLDYGCGKAALEPAVAQFRPWLRWQNYDPAIEGLGAKSPADLVACTDVLEHVEPALLEDVLRDIREHTGKAVFLNIATRPAVKTLPDGRNAHLIVETPDWWLERLMGGFGVREVEANPSEITFVGEPL